MKLYKLTTHDHKTRPGALNECQWGPGVTHRGTGDGDLCSPGYIHAYISPELAVLLNPIHANYQDAVLWECEGEIALRDHDLKVGCIELTTVRIIKAPKPTLEQRVEFAIRCALTVCDAPAFVDWTNRWLSGSDRSTLAAAAVQAALQAAVWGAAAWSARTALAALQAAEAYAVGRPEEVEWRAARAAETAAWAEWRFNLERYNLGRRYSCPTNRAGDSKTQTEGALR